ncbi:hypothetical protein F4775DRAFT_567802 [Biscogniauxia sp. FL1348]|nr:hypothetical protein F4775DRAFT_567802 [Biscogniauxia sp. FL1348]
MAMGGGIMEFLSRYQEYELQRNNTHEFIKDLMIYAEHIESTLRKENSALHQQLRDLQLDLDDASKSRRELQQRLRDVEARIGFVTQDNDQLKNRNAYVLVLIDGDGLLFKENFLSQGLEGGKRAAKELRRAVADHCPHADQTEIIAKIICNASGPNRSLKPDNSSNSEANLRDFIAGFNQAKGCFDFIDLGHGEERIDYKIKDITRFHLRNYNCKQILLGVSHDASYSPFLEELIGDHDSRERITVLEGFPAIRDIVSTGVHIMSFKNVFRSDKPIERPSSSLQAARASTPSSAPAIAPPSISYATVTQKVSPPPQLTLPLAPKNTTTAVRVKPRPVPWNPGPRGLDPPIPINPTVLENIKKRKDSNKLCNNHYLRGPCTKGDECCFEHNYNPSKDEKNAIALLARLNPCTNGQECEVENCIYGHHCPSVINGICTHPFCKFRVEEHPPGTTFKTPKS